MNDSVNSLNESKLSSILINNQIPATQSLSIQNTNENKPIQLRVDSVTDYNALFFTLGASVLVSAITAFVTIWLITRSNHQLIKGQRQLQEDALKNDRKKELDLLTSRNRQEWINSLRIDIAEVVSQSSNIIHNLRATLQITYIQRASEDNIENFSIFISSYQKVDSLISKIELFLNKEKMEQNELISELNSLKENLLRFCNKNLSTDDEFYKSLDEVLVLKTSLTKNINNISEKTATIIKNEWKKTKLGE